MEVGHNRQPVRRTAVLYAEVDRSAVSEVSLVPHPSRSASSLQYSATAHHHGRIASPRPSSRSLFNRSGKFSCHCKPHFYLDLSAVVLRIQERRF